jgi:dCTP deaminase
MAVASLVFVHQAAPPYPASLGKPSIPSDPGSGRLWADFNSFLFRRLQMTVINRALLIARVPIEGMLKEKISHNGVSHGLSEVGYDIRLKQEVRFRPDRLGMTSIVCEEDSKEVTINRGRFALASAMEHFHMPSNMMAVVHDKSTWARRGLSVFNTVIEPGWRGFLTLELVYHCEDELVIPAGSGIAQVIFHEIAIPVNYQGKYQDQPNQPIPAIAG